MGPVQQDGQDPQTVTFHYMATWRRHENGVWRILAMVGQPEPGEAEGQDE